MSFRMNNTSKSHMPVHPSETEEKLKKGKILLEPTELKQYRDKFLYYPTTQSIEAIENQQALSTEDYLNKFSYNGDNKSLYEEEELVLDTKLNIWKIVKKSELHKYC
jgi:hypothetical protein